MCITDSITTLFKTVFSVDTLMIIYAIVGFLIFIHVVVTVVLIAGYVFMKILELFLRKGAKDGRS